MTAILKNQYLTVTSKSKGAELISIIDNVDKTEYLWTANEIFWPRHAPILFPIVGSVKDNKYNVNGLEYNLNQHGFARDCVFTLVNQTSTQLTYQLVWNEYLLTVYPFKFELEVQYTLIDRKLEVSYKVNNCDTKDIYFSIGAHPGFNCPLKGSNSFNDYYFEFEKAETASVMPLSKLGLLSNEQQPYLNNSKTIEFTDTLFAKGALVFSNLQSDFISLKSKTSDKGIKFTIKGFPYLGLWSKAEGAPFVCIEPWYGHADFDDFEGDISQKAGIQKLGVEKVFSCNYVIEMLS